MPTPNETQFEDFICAYLADHAGYDAVKNDKQQAAPRDFDAVRGLDTPELFHFLGSTQVDEWNELLSRYGNDPDVAQAKFADRLASELDKRGVVDVLRNGVVDQGVTLQLCFFKPAFGLSPDLVARYEANRVTATRQLRYDADAGASLDLALFVNGIPVATVELKNPMTGQGVKEGMDQYRTTRDPKNRTLSRCVVHFAVDPLRVSMTTRLAGKATRFLPFNRGDDLHAGNPSNPDGHATSYLWEHVWEREAWLDLLGRFVHVEKPGRGSRTPATVIFPRYHQWDCVLRLEKAARDERAGHSYLVQHSAGSGKSNTIAWLAHRLSTLHDGDDKVFDKVVVITDRLVLDRQLQDTIYQFEHVHGVVERIAEGSQQLADALTGAQARIVITTLQKFPHVLDKLGELPSRTYAVIVDEAHSSQTGESAKDLKRALGAVDVDGDELAPDAVEEALANEIASRGRQPNLSFFAFTATPKGKTLELFGRLSSNTGKHEPFHLYAMRQAIEEGFIHDVLASYTTYDTFFRLEKAIEDDPRYETAKAQRAIAQFVVLHEQNLAQKAQVVVEHFRQHVAHKIGGRAKAMVVTSSRPHAVRFWQALRKYVNDNGIDLGVLVAFSGTVTVDGEDVSESKANGFGESQTAERFDGDDFQLMVVAEKFQTGFDQPKLYAMYVDKVLSGLSAVQTLSRLNRIHDDKDGTFVLDFVNDADEIAEAFEAYHAKTVAPPSDPNLLYDTRHALDEFDVLRVEEAVTLAGFLLAPSLDHARIHAALGPAIDRFRDLAEDEQERLRDALGRFIRVYAFLAQIVHFADTALERDYLFCRSLAPLIKRDAGEQIDLSGEIEVTHLRTEKRFEGSVSLDADIGEVQTIWSGTGRLHEPEPEALSAIIERFNARFGANLTDADILVFDAAADDLVADQEVQLRAANNSEETFGIVFPDMFERALLGRMERNEDVVFKFLDDDELAADVRRVYATLVHARAKVAYQEHCPIVELLAPGAEGQHLEYKASLRTTVPGGEVLEALEHSAMKTIAAFANSRAGGTLLIGVTDEGALAGLEADYASLHTPDRDDRDTFVQHLSNLMVGSMGAALASSVSVQMHTVDGADLCRVHVTPSSFPIEASG